MCLSDTWKEISAEFFADEIFFPSQGAEVQRPEQIPASGTNRHKWRLE